MLPLTADVTHHTFVPLINVGLSLHLTQGGGWQEIGGGGRQEGGEESGVF